MVNELLQDSHTDKLVPSALEKNVPKIVDLKSSSEQIFSENCRWVPLHFLVVAARLRVSTHLKLIIIQNRFSPSRVKEPPAYSITAGQSY